VVLADTTARVLSTDESARALAFARVMAFMTGLGVLALPFLRDAARPLYWPMAIVVVLLFLTSSVMWWASRRRVAGPSRAMQRAFTGVCVVCGVFIVYDLGVFSPAPLFFMLGIAFVAQSHDRVFAISIASGSAVSYFVLAGLVTAGILPDYGLFSITAGPMSARVLWMVLVPAAFAIAAWQGRQSRRATLAAMEQSHEALRLALTREAQLEEAHQNLDQALRAGAGASGRYTGVLMGRYRLAEIVGRGAMGEIYAAADVESGESAAVKVLNAEVCRDPDLVERFFREGRIAARLSAPNVVTVFDVGQSDDGVPFIAMELLVGQDLSALLRQKERLDLATVVEIVGEVARGLEAAHAAGVVHRDLKPHNIFCVEQPGGKKPVWKILDFGVSKLRDSSATLTNAAVIGTPGYMAPEQAEGKHTDHRADLFSLGAVVYRALTGRPPFGGGGDLPRALFEIAYKSPVRPTELLPSLPSDFDAFIAVALAKRPDDRFASAADLASALRDASRGALDPALRAKGAALIEAAPWGSSLRAA
jgi:serine/threonine-protein kinase